MEKLLEYMGEQLRLTSSELEKVKVPENVWNTIPVDYDLYLVGRVLTRKYII